MIEESYALNLNTNGHPYHWAGHFKQRDDKKAEFLKDYRLAVVYLVNRMALNPHGYQSQSVGSASANYSRWIPRECEILMRKWGGPRSVTRDGGGFRTLNVPLTKPYSGNLNQSYLRD